MPSSVQLIFIVLPIIELDSEYTKLLLDYANHRHWSVLLML